MRTAPVDGPKLSQGYRLALGFTRGGPETRLTIDDPLPLYA